MMMMMMMMMMLAHTATGTPPPPKKLQKFKILAKNSHVSPYNFVASGNIFTNLFQGT